jgi:hypothetical protein
MLVTVTSPAKNASLKGNVEIVATAEQTANTDGNIFLWAVFDAGKLLWVDLNPDPAIDVTLALSSGAHTLLVVAYDDSFTGSTATVPVNATSSGVEVTWKACIYTKDGEQYQAMKFSPKEPVTGVLQSEMFWNSDCDPTQWTDQLNDVGRPTTFGSDFSYIYYFIHRANTPDVSAVWTIGNQTSGCVNYKSAPAC